MQNTVTTEAETAHTDGQDISPKHAEYDSNTALSMMRSPSLLASIRFAAAGLKHAFLSQRNFKIHVLITSLVVLGGVVLQIHLDHWVVLVIVIGFVFQTELTNTAVEALVDRVSPEWHELAKIAKDCSAAAVLVTAIAAVLVGLMIFVPYLQRLLSA